MESDELIKVHRRVKENGTVILRNVTTHTLTGLNLSQNSAILASFEDSIKVTHKGKFLKVSIELFYK